MRTVDTATYDAMVEAPDKGLTPRNLVWFVARSLDGLSTQPFGFWNELDTATVSVLRGDTGTTENRVYEGDGSLLDISPIVLTSDLTVQSVTISLSQIHASVQNMVRGYDIRSAPVEIHRILFDPQTNQPVASAISRFMGKVDKAPIGTPTPGQEGSIPITCRSILSELTRTNPAKKSDEHQKTRSGDRFRQYSGVADVPVFWGTDKVRVSS